MSNTNGIISLIVALVGLFISWFLVFFFFIGFIFPVVAIIFGAIGISRDDSKGMAIAGLVIGIIDLLCLLLVIFLLAAFIAALFGGFGGFFVM